MIHYNKINLIQFYGIKVKIAYSEDTTEYDIEEIMSEVYDSENRIIGYSVKFAGFESVYLINFRISVKGKIEKNFNLSYEGVGIKSFVSVKDLEVQQQDDEGGAIMCGPLYDFTLKGSNRTKHNIRSRRLLERCTKTTS